MLLLYTPATSFFLGELFSSVSINKILQSLPFFPPKLSNRRKWEELGIWSPTVFMDQHRSCLHWWTLAGSQQLGHRATQEARAHFSLTPALRLRGSLRIFLNQSIWHLLSLFNSTTALSFWFFFFFFSFCWDNGTHVSGWWKAIHNYYCSLARCIISLLFNYLYTTTFSGKSLTLAVDANFNFQYQQTESALSEILESTSVQGDKLIVRQPAPVA